MALRGRKIVKHPADWTTYLMNSISWYVGSGQ